MVQSNIIALRNQANAIGFPDSDYASDGCPILAVTEGPSDTDADGMADSWEQEHFGDLNANFWQDADGDGWTNLEEFLNRTHPGIGDDPMKTTESHVIGNLTDFP